MRWARFVCPLVVFAITTVLAQTNPVPFINQPLVPTAIAPAGASFTLTVNGTGFVSGSVINWNGTPLTTTFVNGSQLTATVPASSIATASTASITVSSPSPGGGGSNLLFFSVTAPTSLQFTSLQITPPGSCGPCFNLIAADFNRDSNLDLTFDVLLRNPGGASSLGNGDGTFQPLVGSPGFNFSIVADFNGDGKVDMVGVRQSIAVAPYFASIWLGNGDGTFTLGSTIATGDQSNDPTGYQVAAADFNRDGKLDVAIGDDLGIEVYLGNGDGTFQAGLPPVGGGTALAQAVGDFNGDGKLDMAEIVGTEPNLQLQILLGNGDGTFQTGAAQAGFGSGASLVFPADLNGDGKLDLTIVQTVSPPDPTSVTVLLGNGDGTFGTPTNYLVGASLGGGALADFNADGKLDVMVSTSTNTVPSTTIMVGNGDGTFQSPVVLPISANSSVAAGDFNNDGKLDLAVGAATPTANGVFVLLQEVPQPGLSLPSVTFGSQVVGTASSPLSVTLTNNGSAPLTLSSIGFTGANSGDFSQTNNCPASLAVGANCQINITFAPTATDVRNASLSVTDNATGSPQTASLTGVGQDFSLAPGPQTTATVSPGQSASYQVVVAPDGGFNQTVTLSCSGAPAHSTCSVSPSPVLLNGSAATVSVTVTTAGASAGLTHPLDGPGGNMFGRWLALSGTLGLAMLMSVGGWRRERHRRPLYGLAFLCLFSIGVTISACGGGGSSSSSGGGGTQAGTYNLTVTGTFISGSTNVTHKTNLTLVVQ